MADWTSSSAYDSTAFKGYGGESNSYDASSPVASPTGSPWGG